MRVGVVAVQGAVVPHRQALGRLGVVASEVRQPGDLDGLDAVVLPGGESTTMWKMLHRNALGEELASALGDGMPALGTCAGMILLAGEILDGRSDQGSFGVIDMSVRRNAYGTQVASFEAPLELAGAGEPFPGVFIRAPQVERVGPGVEVLATVEDLPVAVASGPCVATAFHPELSGDDRVHRLLLEATGL